MGQRASYFTYLGISFLVGEAGQVFYFEVAGGSRKPPGWR